MTRYLRAKVEQIGAVAKREPDGKLLFLTVVLFAAGMVTVYCASSTMGLLGKHKDEFLFLRKHLSRGLLGFVAMGLLSLLDPDWLRRHSRKILLLALFLLVLVLTPLGEEVRGARRWLHLGVISLQPAEFMKLALVVYLADFMTRRMDRLQEMRRGLLPPLIVLGAASALILKQPSLGAVVVLGLIAGSLLLAGGARLHHLAAIGIVMVAVGMVSIRFVPYQRDRWESFVDGKFDTSGEEYQVYQGLLGLGSGGEFGKGFGHSQQKYGFLPDPHTDFIITILGEELGFAGIAVVLVLFLLLFLRGLVIAFRASSRFKKLLAFGITSSIFYQMLLNLLVVTHLVPTTGQPLPFFSFGGSNLLFTLAQIGILLSVSRTMSAPGGARALEAERDPFAMPVEAEFMTP